MKGFFLGLVIAQPLLWGCGNVVGAELPAVDKVTGCRFLPPEGWNFATMRWTGPCEGKIASGAGVLRAYSEGKVVAAFYGSLKRGQLEIGVIESESGFLAGRFSNGKRIESGDPQSFIDAFRAASAAATQASQYFQRSGNSASAKYYAQKAKVLEDQMGD